jgi:hypothetical protein
VIRPVYPPPDLDLPSNTEVKPPLGPDGWTGILYPSTDPLQFTLWLDPAERTVRVHATHRNWSSTQQLRDLARILTTAAQWLDEQTEPPTP